MVSVERRGLPAGLRQAPAHMRRKKSRVAPRERENCVSKSPKVPTIYRRRGGGATPRVPTLGGAAALPDGGSGGHGKEEGWRTPLVGLRPT